MNCQAVQTKITESLAAGTRELPEEMAVHREHCRECHAFEQTQRELFASVDLELQRLVNQPVPPSLLPRVRADLEQQPAPREFWTATWSFAALAVSVVVVLSLGAFWNFSTRRNPVPDRAGLPQPGPMVSSEVHSPAPMPLSKSAVAKRALAPVREHKTASPPRPPSTEAMPEIIVLAEEQQAFARFVAHLPPQEAALAALTASAVEKDLPLEIALLKIDEIEIPPLEPTEHE